MIIHLYGRLIRGHSSAFGGVICESDRVQRSILVLSCLYAMGRKVVEMAPVSLTRSLSPNSGWQVYAVLVIDLQYLIAKGN